MLWIQGWPGLEMGQKAVMLSTPAALTSLQKEFKCINLISKFLKTELSWLSMKQSLQNIIIKEGAVSAADVKQEQSDGDKNNFIKIKNHDYNQLFQITSCSSAVIEQQRPATLNQSQLVCTVMFWTESHVDQVDCTACYHGQLCQF